jgi:hypothetical protein
MLPIDCDYYVRTARASESRIRSDFYLANKQVFTEREFHVVTVR